MNILPLIASFTILFSAGMYAFLHETKNLFQERYHIFGSLDIDRQIANQKQKAKYLKSEGEVESEKKGENKTSPKNKIPPRSAALIYPTQKLNIRKLAQPNPPPKLYETASSFIKSLYENTPLYKKGMEQDILDTLIDLIKDHPDATQLEGLLPYVPEDKNLLFYKLFKGTQNEGGYPAITDFIQLGSKTEKPIHLRRASKPLILALLGPKIGGELLDAEQEKFHETGKATTLTKAEIEDFLSKKNVNVTSFADLIDYSNAKGGTEEKRLKAKEQKVQIKHVN